MMHLHLLEIFVKHFDFFSLLLYLEGHLACRKFASVIL